jgi:dihydroflavonol-4-reductase
MTSTRNNPDHTVLVTGGTGYLGGWVVAQALRQGYRVRTTVRDLGRADSLRAAIAAHTPVDALTIVRADLLQENGWADAMHGVDAVVHVASPLPSDSSQDIVATARTGVRNVFTAAGTAGIERVVMTSSLAAATVGHSKHSTEPIDENTWSSLSGRRGDTYARSKTLAERDAWQLAQAHGLSLTTILPGWPMGPAIAPDAAGSSVEIIRQLITGKMPALPNFGGYVVDVRDIADLHVQALTAPQAAGERLLAVGPFFRLLDIARLLRAQLGEQAAKVSTRKLPDVIVRLAAPFNGDMAFLAENLGDQPRIDGTKVERLLGWHTRAPEQAILETASTLHRRA